MTARRRLAARPPDGRDPVGRVALVAQVSASCCQARAARRRGALRDPRRVDARRHAVVAIDDKTFYELERAVAVPALAARQGDRRACTRPARARSSTTSSSPSRRPSARTCALYRRDRAAPAAPCSRPARVDERRAARRCSAATRTSRRHARGRRGEPPDDCGGAIRRFPYAVGPAQPSLAARGERARRRRPSPPTAFGATAR